jgi:hypothetical protein
MGATRVAAYIAKYATKACEDFGIPPGITGSAAARKLGANEHAARIIDTAAWISERSFDQLYERLGRWLHMLGFRGHFATKSRQYSVTLGTLRRARRQWQTSRLRRQRDTEHDVADTDIEPPDAGETTLIVGSWAFAGIGWLTAGDAALAAESATLARDYSEQMRGHTRAA